MLKDRLVAGVPRPAEEMLRFLKTFPHAAPVVTQGGLARDVSFPEQVPHEIKDRDGLLDFDEVGFEIRFRYDSDILGHSLVDIPP